MDKNQISWADTVKSYLKSYWFITLIVIFIIITLYPPFNWEQVSGRINAEKYTIQKEYDFVFNDSYKNFEFVEWDWNYYTEHSVKSFETIKFQRSLILYELILNYLLSFLVIILIYLLNEKIKLSKK